MASLRTIMASTSAQVTAATQGIVVNARPVTVKSAVGWPPLKLLQSIPTSYASGSQVSVIGVYDRQVSKNVTRWKPYSISETTTPATLRTSVGSHNALLPGESVDITLSATVTPGDAVSAVLTSYTTQPRTMTAAVAIGGASDTPTTMALALANAVNAALAPGFLGPPASAFAAASALGPVVTLTNTTNSLLLVESYTGNGATTLDEVGRRMRQIQITTWSPTEEIRAAVTDPIDVMLAQAEMNFGWTLADGSVVRVCPESDFYLEDDSLADVYRRDFIVQIEYPVTAVEELYAVLAPILTIGTIWPAHAGIGEFVIGESDIG